MEQLSALDAVFASGETANAHGHTGGLVIYNPLAEGRMHVALSLK